METTDEPTRIEDATPEPVPFTGRMRAAYWAGIVAAALAFLYGLLMVLASLALSDGAGERVFGGVGAALVILGPAWMLALWRCVRTSTRIRALEGRRRARFRRAHVASVVVGVAFTVLLFAINAGEWTMAPVG